MSSLTREADVESGVRNTHTLADYLYDAIYVAGIGGGLVALFFLAFDVVTRGQAFSTPSLMGSALFGGAVHEAAPVDMLAVAKYSIVHFVAFGLLGLGVSFLTHQAEMRSRHPFLVIGLVFGIFEVGFWIAASVAIPGVLDRIGHLPVAAANLIAAVGVALFFIITHRPSVWIRLKRVAHLA